MSQKLCVLDPPTSRQLAYTKKISVNASFQRVVAATISVTYAKKKEAEDENWPVQCARLSSTTHSHGYTTTKRIAQNSTNLLIRTFLCAESKPRKTHRHSTKDI